MEPSLSMDHPDERQKRRSPAVQVSHPIETQRILSLFGSNTRSGYWEPPERLEVMAMFGGVKLDFRDANLYSGPTVVNCFAMFGGIEIITPVDLEIDANGTGLFGGFDQQTQKSKKRLFRRGRGDRHTESNIDPDDEPPLLRIRGFAMFGGVSIRVK
jgi:predicted membrane protein